jgi:hypothetical protein
MGSRNPSEHDLTRLHFDTAKITLKQLTGVLERSPQLEVLNLENAIVGDKPGYKATRKELAFPKLKSLRLISPGSAIADVLLADPSSLSNLTAVEVNIKASSKEEGSQLVFAIGNLPQFRHSKSLRIESRLTDDQVSVVYQQPVPADWETMEALPDLDKDENKLLFGISWPDDEDDDPYDLSSIWIQCMEQMKLDQFIEFKFTAEVLPLSSEIWKRLFRKMPTLTKLVIGCEIGDNTTAVMGALTPSCLDSKTPTILLPKLQHFELLSQNLPFSGLNFCVQLRQTHGARLSVLKLPGYHREYKDVFGPSASYISHCEDHNPQEDYNYFECDCC